MKIQVRKIPEDQQITPEEAVSQLHNLCENFRMKYGDQNVVALEMAIDALQEKYPEYFDD